MNSQDFEPTQDSFARSHDHETVTFRNSALDKCKVVSKFVILAKNWFKINPGLCNSMLMGLGEDPV